MKITEVKVWLVEGVKYNWTMLKVCTDTGHTGVGEATNWPGSPIIEAAARHVGERVIGLDPMRTDFIWTKLYRDLNWIGPYRSLDVRDQRTRHGAARSQGQGARGAVLRVARRGFRDEIELYANYWFTGGRPHPGGLRPAGPGGGREPASRGLKFDPFAHTNYLYGTDLNTNLALTPG